MHTIGNVGYLGIETTSAHHAACIAAALIREELAYSYRMHSMRDHRFIIGRAAPVALVASALASAQCQASRTEPAMRRAHVHLIARGAA